MTTRRLHPWGPALPVVRTVEVHVSPAGAARARRLAHVLSRSEADLERGSAGWVRPGLDESLPGLVVSDSSGVALASPGAPIEHRVMFLAAEGDIVLSSAPRAPAFEAYCRGLLGLRSAEVVSLPATGDMPLARRCLHEEKLMERLTVRARQAGGLNLKPYMGVDSVWELAARLGDRARVPVHVAGPPPLLSRRVNDKIWFAGSTRQLLGRDAIPPGRAVFDLAELTRRLLALSRACSHVVVKHPSSAGSSGNLVWDCARLRSLPAGELVRCLQRRLSQEGWSFPLLVSLWEQPVLSSPSVQVWIPREGAPVVEGVFSQDLEPEEGRFLGARPAVLPQETTLRLAHEATLMGIFYQELGYFGRCSFDAILVGRSPSGCSLHWVECNGRWGGTSIPMTLANRLLGDWRRRSLVIVHSNRHGPASPWTLRSLLYPQQGIVWITPHRVSFMALATDSEQAEAQVQAVLSRLGTLRAAL